MQTINKVIKKIELLSADLVTKNHIKKFFSNYKSQNSKGEKILIYAGIGHMYISYFEILLYHLLKKEGFEVDYLIYDENIPINEIITKEINDGIGKDKFWSRSVGNAKKLLHLANVKYNLISFDYETIQNELKRLKSIEDVFLFSKDGIELGTIVKGSIYRYYKNLTFGENAFKVAKKLLFTSLVNYYQIKSLTAKSDYKFVMFSHGIYVTWEPVVSFCKKNGIDFIAYDRAKTKDTININFNQVAPDWSFNSAWNKYKTKDLTEQEKSMVTAYLKDRELQTNDVYSYNFSKRSKNIKKLKENLGISLDKKVITIFTNLIWDAANVARDLAFESAFNCVVETIENFKNNKGVHIILRSHPAEKVLGTNERYGDLIREYFKNNLPVNVTIIEPEMNINSFSVIDISDIGVVNTSTVGLEFALLGKPIILIAETHYRDKGFTYDVNSKDEYFQVMNNLLNKCQLLPNQVKLAEKYFYIMMFEYQQELPIRYNNGVFKTYTYNHLSQIPKSNNIYKIINKIKEGNHQDFIDWK